MIGMVVQKCDVKEKHYNTLKSYLQQILHDLEFTNLQFEHITNCLLRGSTYFVCNEDAEEIEFDFDMVSNTLTIQLGAGDTVVRQLDSTMCQFIKYAHGLDQDIMKCLMTKDDDYKSTDVSQICAIPDWKNVRFLSSYAKKAGEKHAQKRKKRVVLSNKK